MTTQMVPAEQISLEVSGYYLTLYVVPPGIIIEKPEEAKAKAPIAITIPLPVAKQVCMIMRKQLLDLEARQGTIQLLPGTHDSINALVKEWPSWGRVLPDSPEQQGPAGIGPVS